jgi:hypothetical protein
VAVPFVQSAANPSTGLNVTATLGAAPTQNNLLVAHVAQQATNTFTPSAGWAALTEVTSTDEGLLLWKIAGAAEQAAQTPCVTSSATRNWECIVAEYSSVAASPLLAENGQADNDATKTSPSVTPTAGLRALCIGAAFSTTASTGFSAQKLNGSTTGVTERQDQGSGSGSNQVRGCLWDAEITSTSGSYTVEATASVSEAGGVSIAIFKLTSGTTFNQSASATSTGTPTAVRQTGLVRSATSTGTSTAARQVALVRSTTSTATATARRSAELVRAASSTATASALRAVGKLVTASSTGTAAALRSVALVRSATATGAAATARLVAKSAAATATGTVTMAKTVSKSVTALATGTASAIASFAAEALLFLRDALVATVALVLAPRATVRLSEALVATVTLSDVELA